MRKITLYSPTVDRHGKYRDAGSVLTVGADDNADTDITTIKADELTGSGRAVTMAAAAAAEKVDPLDHDANGRKGGDKPAPK